MHKHLRPLPQNPRHNVPLTWAQDPDKLGSEFKLAWQSLKPRPNWPSRLCCFWLCCSGFDIACVPHWAGGSCIALGAGTVWVGAAAAWLFCCWLCCCSAADMAQWTGDIRCSIPLGADTWAGETASACSAASNSAGGRSRNHSQMAACA